MQLVMLSMLSHLQHGTSYEAGSQTLPNPLQINLHFILLRYEEFRVLSPAGEFLDIMELDDAMKLADENEADLILVKDETDFQEALV